MVSKILTAALAYAERGKPVFPCHPQDKKPLVEGGLHSATTDADQIKTWWGKWPNAMIGVPTGPASGFFVLDVDRPKKEGDPDGLHTITELQKKHGFLEGFTRQSTPSGGFHYLFKWPSDAIIKNSAKKIAPGLDVRGEGGYIVITPSFNTKLGKAYQWEVNAKPADAPQWVFDLIVANNKKERSTTPPARKVAAVSSNQPYALAAFNEEVERLSTWPPGGRNEALNAAAFSLGTLVGAGALDREQVIRGLYHACESNGLIADDGENAFFKTAESGLEAGMASPRDIPKRETLNSVNGPAVTNGTNRTNSTEEVPEESENRILPPPPPVPLEAFPAPVASMMQEAAAAFSVPLQIPAACMLSFVSRLVGRSRLISVKESWAESANLWIAVVAQSGMGKSPCMKAFARPVELLEYEAKRAFDDAYSDYEGDLYQYQAQRSHNAKQQARGKALDDGSPLIRPDEPNRKQVIVDDSTMESLGNALRANPKGLVWDKDELAGLMADADKYSNSTGGQRARLLSSYDCGPWKVDRVSDPRRNLYIPKACVGIFGGIQPGMMSSVFEAGSSGVDEASGFLQRFIFVRAEADAPSYWTEAVFSRESRSMLEQLAAHLWQWDITYNDKGQEIDAIVPVSRQAKRLFVEWYNSVAEESFLSNNRGLSEKLKAKALRICLILHSLDAALVGSDGMSIVTEDCMRRALLLTNWVKEQQEQCWRFFSADKAKQADPIERAIMQVVVEQAGPIESNGWRIGNSDFFPLIEAKLNMPGLSSVKIGKAASGLGLPVCWMTSKDKGRTITQEKISSFKTSVGSVGSVGYPTDTRVSSGEPTVGNLLVTVGRNVPAWAQPTDTNGSPTVPLVKKGVAGVAQPTEPTEPTVDSGDSFNFDFNDPNFPDEVTL